MRSVRYQPIFHTLSFTLAHMYNNIFLTTVIEMVEIQDGRVGERSVERVSYVINNLLHLVTVKYGVMLVVCICTGLRLVKILTPLVKQHVTFHADQCNWASEASPTLGYSIEISRDIYIFITYIPCSLYIFL